MRILLSTLLVAFALNSSVGQIRIDSLYNSFTVEDRYPSFFPDGNRIVFQSNRSTGTYQIFSANQDGSDILQLTNSGANNVTPAISPDGKFITFCSCTAPAGPCDIMMMNSDGTNLKVLVSHPSDDSHPKFTKNGDAIIFCSDRDKPGTSPSNSIAELYQIDLQTKRLQKLTNNGIWNTYPSYSPQSAHIIYRRIIQDPTTSKMNSEIFIMDADGKNIKNLTNHSSYDAYPEFSPDGEWILFSSNRNSKSSNFHLFVMDKNGQNIQQVSYNESEESDQRATWAPNGSKIIFNRERDRNVRIMVAEVAPVAAPQVFCKVENELTIDRGCSRGVAWGDFNNDSYPDLVVANSNNQNLRLYKNNGHAFERFMEDPVMSFADYSEGVAWIDFDNDHDLDLFVTAHNEGKSTMFRNDSLEHFIKVSVGDLTEDKRNSNTSCWCDFDNDGDADVFVSHKNAPGTLYENIQGKSFTRVANTRFPMIPGDGRTCSWGDIDGDGYFELFVGNFTETLDGKNQNANNYLFKNEKGKSFTQILTGDVVNHRARTYGSSFADFDNDGDADLLVTNIGRNDTSYIYQNNGNGILSRKYVSHGKPSKGHTWGDYNMDGYLDLMIANGTEGISPKLVDDDMFYGGPNGLTKVNHGSIVNDHKISACVAQADYDNDGDLDLIVTNWGNNLEANNFYRNDVENKSWLKVKLIGKKSHPYGLNAKVIIRYEQGKTRGMQTRWLIPQTGYGGQNDFILHFGLDNLSMIDEVTIHWPSGITQSITMVKSNQLLQVLEPVH